tara:strand:- start:427 stop:591 length:165 start_codon:yes stop_codon:yes gene_type:complete
LYNRRKTYDKEEKEQKENKIPQTNLGIKNYSDKKDKNTEKIGFFSIFFLTRGYF